jgi:hypothetical protein
VRYQAALRPDKMMLMNFILTDFSGAGISAGDGAAFRRLNASVSVSVIKNGKSEKQGCAKFAAESLQKRENHGRKSYVWKDIQRRFGQLACVGKFLHIAKDISQSDNRKYILRPRNNPL